MRWCGSACVDRKVVAPVVRVHVQAVGQQQRTDYPNSLFATLGPTDLPSRPYLPKGAKGGRVRWSTTTYSGSMM
jgi:hypothetical protein